MKFKSLLFFLFSVGLTSLSQISIAQTATHSSDYAIDFYGNSFDECIKEAAKQKKLIFVDAYTSWCGPCKMMSNTTFKDEAVGKFFNENFLSMKIDMEKNEGPKLAMKFGVRAYPTLIFFNSKGEEIHRALGYQSTTQLIEQGKAAIAKK